MIGAVRAGSRRRPHLPRSSLHQTRRARRCARSPRFEFGSIRITVPPQSTAHTDPKPSQDHRTAVRQRARRPSPCSYGWNALHSLLRRVATQTAPKPCACQSGAFGAPPTRPRLHPTLPKPSHRTHGHLQQFLSDSALHRGSGTTTATTTRRSHGYQAGRANACQKTIGEGHCDTASVTGLRALPFTIVQGSLPPAANRPKRSRPPSGEGRSRRH